MVFFHCNPLPPSRGTVFGQCTACRGPTCVLPPDEVPAVLGRLGVVERLGWGPVGRYRAVVVSVEDWERPVWQLTGRQVVTLVHHVHVTQLMEVNLVSAAVTAVSGITRSRSAFLFVWIAVRADHKGIHVVVVQTVPITVTWGRR